MHSWNTTDNTSEEGKIHVDFDPKFLLCVGSLIFLLRFLWLLKTCFYKFFKEPDTIMLTQSKKITYCKRINSTLCLNAA